MSRELLYLNQSPSAKVNRETLVSIALRDKKGLFPISLLEIILKNGFDANQRIQENLLPSVNGRQSMIMLFLARSDEDCVRHLWNIQDLEVDATDSYGQGLFHYSLTHELDFLQFMLHTMKVPLIDSKMRKNVLFGAHDIEMNPWISDRNDIKEDVLDWFIDEFGADCYSKNIKEYKINVLNQYIGHNEVKLDRVKYWIEKRKVDPWKKDWHAPRTWGRNAFRLIAEKDDKGEITTEVRDYFASLIKSAEDDPHFVYY